MRASSMTRGGEPAARGLSAFAPDPSRRPLGGSGIDVAPLAFGAWGIGGGWGPGADADDARAAVARALERGITLFDTAPTYGDGVSESLLGRALGGQRDRVVLATKCGPHDPPAASLAASLERLRTDRVDLLQLHEVPPGDGALERQIAAMHALVEHGLARAIGICNADARALARARTVAPLASAQSQYNLFDRDAEGDVLALTRDSGLGFLAYRPLASGLLTGKFDAPPAFSSGDHRARIWWFRGREFDRRRAAIARLERIARDRELSLAQLALSWVLSREGVTAVLAGARSAAQVDENVAARVLDDETIAAIDAVVAAIYAPRALRRGITIADAPDAAGAFPVTGADGRTLGVGAREAHVMRRLDGRSRYDEIARAWSGGRLLVAQIVLLVDQLEELGLLEDSHD